MKTLLVVVGILLLLGAAYGFITVDDSVLPTEATDAAVDAANATGVTANLGLVDQVKVFLVDNRLILAIAGAIALVVGLFLPRDRRRP